MPDLFTLLPPFAPNQLVFYTLSPLCVFSPIPLGVMQSEFVILHSFPTAVFPPPNSRPRFFIPGTEFFLYRRHAGLAPLYYAGLSTSPTFFCVTSTSTLPLSCLPIFPAVHPLLSIPERGASPRFFFSVRSRFPHPILLQRLIFISSPRSLSVSFCLLPPPPPRHPFSLHDIILFCSVFYSPNSICLETVVQAPVPAQL